METGRRLTRKRGEKKNTASEAAAIGYELICKRQCRKRIGAVDTAHHLLHSAAHSSLHHLRPPSLRLASGCSSSHSVSFLLASSSSWALLKFIDQLNTNKFEEVVFMGSASSSSSSSSSMARPMERIHEMGPPPFLMKTFEMVEDPSTDAIVSWNEARNSLIVWDSYRLASNLLPKYFKRTNFSSFVRQLNTYPEASKKETECDDEQSEARRGEVTEDEDDGGKTVQRSEEDGER
ncbi:hypothetical protein Syun_027425 [Stephania yunnanensis]|uniref:HSF-type DNA-binding domain-containing protein n=1 Tax=Stephania yunnanensis TaxID=152371 RepID=A0AAP0EPF7_9MAGN